jgi:hypothetical protein
MRALNLSGVVMAAALLLSAQALAQSQKQPTQEGAPSMPTAGGTPAYKQPTQGAPSMPMPCGLPYNANPGADPDCKKPSIQR